MNNQLDVNDVVNGLLDEIAKQAKEISLLRVQLTLLTRQQAQAEQPGGEENGSDTVPAS